MENHMQFEKPTVRYAEFGTRLVAMLIDIVIMLIITAIIFVGFGISFYNQSDEVLSNTWMVGFILYYIFGIPLTSLLYYSLFESSKRQATPGKIVMRIIVVNDQFEQIRFLQALGRNAGRFISGFLLIGYFIALGNKKCQTLHDQMANTYVILK